jgi:RNA polymerase-interacting CarD/CdnL/TRCF family regulator
MGFAVGDEVIHCSFGVGKIINVEEKIINELPLNCYVVELENMTIWIPVENPGKSSLRHPTPPEEFKETLKILSSPNQDLPVDRVIRRKELLDRFSDGQLSSICMIVRDLNQFKQKSKLNDQEKSMLERAIKSLLTEWTLSLGTPLHQANLQMESMLL